VPLQDTLEASLRGFNIAEINIGQHQLSVHTSRNLIAEERKNSTEVSVQNQ
jgi:hypothetical protein